MSLYDYRKAIELRNDESVSFYSLIMAAILKADTDNMRKLDFSFPYTVNEVHNRYWSPGGELPTDGQERVVITEIDIDSLYEEEQIRDRESLD